MTKPLIQQLAERAGVTVREDVSAWNIHELTVLLSALCAHLDEQPKAKTQAESIGDLLYEADRNNVVLLGSHVCTPDCPDSHRSNVELHEPPAAPEVAERPAIHSDPARAWPILMSRLRAMATRVFTNSYINDLANDFDDCGVAIESKLSEARAELASRCDHHAAIHELNRELAQARADNAQNLAAAHAWHESAERNHKAMVNREAELAKVTAERDAMTAVVEAAGEYILALDRGQNGHAFRELLRTVNECRALTAAARPPEETPL